MTTQANIPLKWYVPFANGDATRVEIPVTTADPTRASQTLGFPPLTMQPPESGGVPPQGEDFNGGMNQIARVAWWVLNGGGWPYDASFATNGSINGYPNGATLQAADFRGDWINTADNNQNNPDTTGTGWVPGFQYGVTALAGLTGGTVTPTPAQAAKRAITLAGTLGSALTVILPTWLKDWDITNNTTGAFTVIVKTAGGSGVTIPQNGAPTRVTGDGTNIVQVAPNIAAATTSTQAMQFGQATGRLLNVRVITSTGTYTPTAGTNSITVDACGGGSSGGNAGVTNASQASVGGGGSAGTWARARYTTGFSGVTVTIGAGGTAGGGGGTTSFGALLTCPGGGASATLTTATGTPAIAAQGALGAFPTGSGIIFATFGVAGLNGYFLSVSATGVQSGQGASGPFGSGGLQTSGGPGNPAGGYGAGGSGAVNGPSSSAVNGGNGAPGVVIVYEYA